MIRLALALALMATPAAAERVVSLGGSVSEIVAALGAADRLVARDSTTSWPPELARLPDVGYVRALSPEGVLSVGPELILAEEGAGPVEAVEALKATGLPYAEIPEDPSPQGVAAKIRAVAAALDLEASGETLAQEVDAGFARVEAARAGVATPARVLFILSAQGGRLTVAGAGTAAEGIIALAGGVNAAQGFSGYKPMSDEAILAARPQAIVMMDRGGDHALSDRELYAHPALAGSEAAARGVIRMDGLLLLGFGPRTPEAALRLHDALYGSAG